MGPLTAGPFVRRAPAKAQVEAAQRRVRYSKSALTGVRDEAQAGQRTTLDVLNAVQALLNARVSLIVAQRDRVVASYSFLSAVGRLSAETLGLPVWRYDPNVHYQQVRDSWFGVIIPDGPSQSPKAPCPKKVTQPKK